ncbi:MAG: hypothetical protein JNK87_20135 [Bryobacterales bacterium]|nr:hypothetical protein [Bryobacterales bacterium]
MACYIASRENRFYVNVEESFGAVAAVTASHRFTASAMEVKEEALYPQRRDKTGTRTRGPVMGPLRRKVQFAVKSYLVGTEAGTAPNYGPLVHSAMGKEPLVSAGGIVESVPASNRIRFTTPHEMVAGQGVSFGGEVRFVAAVVDEFTVELNIPFTLVPGPGALTGPTVSYALGNDLKSLSLFDYWSPESAVQRIVSGGVVNRMTISVNGDVHDLEFAGPARDVIDSSSFENGVGELMAFPLEPAVAATYEAVPVSGHLGQAWIGAVPSQFLTLTKASVELDNGVEMRSSEFGSSLPRCVVPGAREVTFDCMLYGRDDGATKEIYQAARTRSPLQVMLQLGQQGGQMMGVYVKSLVPEVPEFVDKETRLQWKLSGCLAEGSSDDELYIAFA